jgi:hypothetical protein
MNMSQFPSTGLVINRPALIGLKANPVPTVKIKSEDTEMGWAIINKADFDPTVHQLWEPAKPEAARQPGSPQGGQQQGNQQQAKRPGQ